MMPFFFSHSVFIARVSSAATVLLADLCAPSQAAANPSTHLSSPIGSSDLHLGHLAAEHLDTAVALRHSAWHRPPQQGTETGGADHPSGTMTPVRIDGFAYGLADGFACDV